jgi:antirestriction protein ArdC
VFNVEQIEGLPEVYYTRPERKFSSVERIAHADRFFANTRAMIRYGGARAYLCSRKFVPVQNQ